MLTFLTDLTNRKGAVKNLDERLRLMPQQVEAGFILQVPRSKESGGRYYLDEALIAAAGSDFYSVADRMEVVIPPERIEQVLGVVMHQRNETLAAFEFKEVARQLMGVSLPTLETVTVEPVKPPMPPQPAVPTVETPALPASGVAETPDSDPVPVAAASSPAEPDLRTVQPADIPAIPESPPLPPMGQLEKRILRFLRKAELEQEVMGTQEFHRRIENEPFMPLVVERQGNELYLTHYRTQNGDMFIDSEMVFRVRGEGHLEFKETAVQSLRGGESRQPDRAFAQIFSKNIVQQGFAEAAQAQAQAQAQADPPIEAVEPVDERATMRADLRQYLDVQAQHPEAIVLVQSPDLRFYEAFLEGVQPLTEHLELIATRVASGVPALGQVLAAGFPAERLPQYLETLTQHGAVAVAEGDGSISVHPHQPLAPALEASAQEPMDAVDPPHALASQSPESQSPSPVVEEPEVQIQSLPTPEASAPAAVDPRPPSPAVEEPEFQIQSLFDMGHLNGASSNGQSAPQSVSAEPPQPAPAVSQAAPPSPLPSASAPVLSAPEPVPDLSPADTVPVMTTPNPVRGTALETLRDWYRAARDLGHDPLHLEHIKQLGLSAKHMNGNGLALTPTLEQAMAQDLAHYQTLQRRGAYVAQASRTILSAIGQTQGAETQFRGKVYELKQTADRLTVRRVTPQPQTILEMAQGKIQRTVVTAEDCQRFQRFMQRLAADRASTPTLAGLER